jgi:hypothetical protein
MKQQATPSGPLALDLAGLGLEDVDAADERFHSCSSQARAP